ncbi:hypothetical protein BJX61DRAFT_553107 [Aspergillus egyptiacus]|nr:hypothetical protein BJX61DRAFT_553107 [Aspergillus egyptiacus]
MSPIKESSSPTNCEKDASSSSVIRRSKAVPTDSPGTKFLYTIIKQLDLKGRIDWNLVASQLQISNGHAARMRYHRFRNQMEGITPKKGRRAVTKPTTKVGLEECKGGLREECSPQPSQVKREYPAGGPHESNPYFKTETYSPSYQRLADIPRYGSPIPLPSQRAPPAARVPVPYSRMTLPSELPAYAPAPLYPPVPYGFDQGYGPPVPWTPVKLETKFEPMIEPKVEPKPETEVVMAEPVKEESASEESMP